MNRHGIKNGDIVKHFKRQLGGYGRKDKAYLYKVLETDAIHTETLEKLVIYQALYDDGAIYARPQEMFFGLVDKQKYPDAEQAFRFECLQDIEIEGIEAVNKLI